MKGNNMIIRNPARKKQEGPLKKSSQIPNHLWPSAKGGREAPRARFEELVWAPVEDIRKKDET